MTLSPPTQDLRILFFVSPAGNDHGALSVYTDAEGQPLGGNVQHSLLQFDLSSIPSAAIITSATLTLTHDSAIYYTGQPAGTQTNLLAAAESWNTNATWNTRDGSTNWTTPGGTTAGLFAVNNTTIPANSGLVPVPFDVTALVSAWVSGSLANNGALLVGTKGDGLHFYIAGANGPSLLVNYVPEPSSFILCAFGAIGLFVVTRRRRKA